MRGKFREKKEGRLLTLTSSARSSTPSLAGRSFSLFLAYFRKSKFLPLLFWVFSKGAIMRMMFLKRWMMGMRIMITIMKKATIIISYMNRDKE